MVRDKTQDKTLKISNFKTNKKRLENPLKKVILFPQQSALTL